MSPQGDARAPIVANRPSENRKTADTATPCFQAPSPTPPCGIRNRRNRMRCCTAHPAQRQRPSENTVSDGLVFCICSKLNSARRLHNSRVCRPKATHALPS
ncbi:hypothetical protein [Kingella potus]|uniref:hypothetical protein n=1 Tax=Kingella potus TaxID=265175 RepID=UPI001FD267C5|nr:hypothetical protein [Kingella potus]UOP00272.1 hypothetical protein LVJ84_10180 [Kingella potus]